MCGEGNIPMNQRTTSSRDGKPEKPRPDFPHFPHATKRWAKKIRGKLHYFGPWDHPEGALERYLDQKDDLSAGRIPRPTKGDAVLVRDILNHFLTAKSHLLDSREITARTWADYHATCERMAEAFGRTRPVDDIRGSDFTDYRARYAKRWGPVALGNEIQRVRSVFKHAFDAELIATPVRFGPGFKRPSKKVLRKARAEKGLRLFQPEELRAVLDSAGTPFKAMILLGINCGYGNAECATLPLTALDLEKGWAHFPRPKTGIDRRCPLWPETIEAIREALKKRPALKDVADDGLAFITKFGAGWDKSSSGKNHANPISWEMKKVLKSVWYLAVKEKSGERPFLVGKRVEVKVRGQRGSMDDIKKGADVTVSLSNDATGKAVCIEVGGPRKSRPSTVRGKVVSNSWLLRPGLSFYTLRHCFETIGGEAKDQAAVDHIMGHARDDMASVYREKISDERLRAVTDKVHAWLFGH